MTPGISYNLLLDVVGSATASVLLQPQWSQHLTDISERILLNSRGKDYFGLQRIPVGKWNHFLCCFIVINVNWDQ